MRNLLVLLFFASLSITPWPAFGDSAMDGYIKAMEDKPTLAIMNFAYENLSESTAKSLLKQLTEIVAGSEKFNIIDSEAINSRFQESNLELANCSEVSCGYRIAKELGVKYFLLDSLEFTEPNYQFQSRLYNAQNNEIEFSESVELSSSQFEAYFFSLPQKIANSIPRWAKVVAADDARAIVNQGSLAGVKLGDEVTLYRSVLTVVGKALEPSAYEFQPIAVIKIDNVSEQISSGNYLYRSMVAQSGDDVLILAEKSKQAIQSADSRRIIDKYVSFPPPQVESKSRIDSSIAQENITDYSKIEWISKVRHYEAERDLYRYVTIGVVAAAVGLYAFNVTSPIPYGLALAAGGYSLAKFLSARSSWQDLVDEGIYKNYLDPLWNPTSMAPTKNPNKTIVLFSYNSKF